MTSAVPSEGRRRGTNWRWLLLYAVVIPVCGVAIARELGASGLGAVLSVLEAMDKARVAASASCVAGVFASIMGMEYLAFRRAERPAGARLRLFPALVANALSLGSGFGMLSGGALRARLYAAEGLKVSTSFYIASSVTLMSVLGGVFIAALGFGFAPVATHAGPLWRWGGKIALVAFLIGVIAAGARGRTLTVFGREFALPNAAELSAGVALGALDWIFSAGALFMLLPDTRWSDAPAFATIFAGSHLAAMVTGAPNGLGVFDAIMIAAMSAQIDPPRIAAALIVYRVTAFVLPVALGLTGLTALEARSGMRRGARPWRVRGALTHWLLLTLIGAPRIAVGDDASKGKLFSAAAGGPAAPLRTLTGKGTVLVLAPHPDDDVLGCGGLIAACVAAAIPVRVVYLTDGRRSHMGSRRWPGARLAQQRRLEAIEAVRALGLGEESLVFLGASDALLLLSRRAQSRAFSALDALVRRENVTSIFAPWVHDPHPDHVATAELARRLARGGPGAYYYPIWGSFLPDRVVLRDRPWGGVRLDVSAHLAAKRAAVDAHRSQMTPLIQDALVDLRPLRSEREFFLRNDEIFFFDASKSSAGAGRTGPAGAVQVF